MPSWQRVRLTHNRLVLTQGQGSDCGYGFLFFVFFADVISTFDTLFLSTPSHNFANNTKYLKLDILCSNNLELKLQYLYVLAVATSLSPIIDTSSRIGHISTKHTISSLPHEHTNRNASHPPFAFTHPHSFLQPRTTIIKTDRPYPNL